MTESISNFMEHNPKLLWVMGVPLLLFLGHTLFDDKLARVLCGVAAACTMTAVTVMALLTARWTDLMWPGIGFILWSGMIAVRKAME